MGMTVLILSQQAAMPKVDLWKWQGDPKVGQEEFAKVHGYLPSVAYLRLDSPDTYYMVEDNGEPQPLVTIPFTKN